MNIEEIRRLFENNRVEEAREAIRSWPRDCTDTNFLRELAEIMELIGCHEDAIEVWKNIEKLDDSPEASEKLMDFAIDQGEITEAVHYGEEALRLGTLKEEVYHNLGRYYEEEGKWDKARRVYQLGWERLESPVLKAKLDKLPVKEKPIETRIPLSDDVCIQILPYFSGHEGVYALQWVDRKGNIGYRPVHEPLTPAVIRRHLQGDYTVGVYPVRVDNTVLFIAWDIDINKSILEKYKRNPQVLGKLAKATHDAAVTLHLWWKSRDIPTIIEDSGFKGRHVWLFLREPMEARIAHKIAQRVAAMHPLPGELHYEVYPRQETITPGKLGNLIKLPLGIHRRTGRRCLFLLETGEPYDDSLGALLETNRVFPQTLIDVVRREITVDVVKTEEPQQLLTEGRQMAEAALPPYHPETDPEFLTLITFCSALRALVEKARLRGMLSYDEQLVVVHTFGYLTHGVEAVNMILGMCLNTNERLLLKSPLRGNPISCPKMRQRIPEITANFPCECPHALEFGYPTPILFLKLKESYDKKIWWEMEKTRLGEAFIYLQSQMDNIKSQQDEIVQRLKGMIKDSETKEFVLDKYHIKYDPSTDSILVSSIQVKKIEG